MKLKLIKKLTNEAYEKALIEREEAYDNALLNYIVNYFKGQLVPVWLFIDQKTFPYYAEINKDMVVFFYNEAQIWSPLYYKEANDLIISWYPKMVNLLCLPKFISRNDWCEIYPVDKETIRKEIISSK